LILYVALLGLKWHVIYCAASGHALEDGLASRIGKRMKYGIGIGPSHIKTITKWL
jgi:hypothetical protein